MGNIFDHVPDGVNPSLTSPSLSAAQTDLAEWGDVPEESLANLGGVRDVVEVEKVPQTLCQGRGVPAREVVESLGPVDPSSRVSDDEGGLPDTAHVHRSIESIEERAGRIRHRNLRVIKVNGVPTEETRFLDLDEDVLDTPKLEPGSLALSGDVVSREYLIGESVIGARGPVAEKVGPLEDGFDPIRVEVRDAFKAAFCRDEAVVPPLEAFEPSLLGESVGDPPGLLPIAGEKFLDGVEQDRGLLTPLELEDDAGFEPRESPDHSVMIRRSFDFFKVTSYSYTQSE